MRVLCYDFIIFFLTSIISEMNSENFVNQSILRLSINTLASSSLFDNFTPIWYIDSISCQGIIPCIKGAIFLSSFTVSSSPISNVSSFPSCSNTFIVYCIRYKVILPLATMYNDNLDGEELILLIHNWESYHCNCLIYQRSSLIVVLFYHS